MKKNVLFLVAITTCSLAFTACSKVEAPYVKPEEPVVPSKPDNPANPTTPKDGTLLSEAFTTTSVLSRQSPLLVLANGRLISKLPRLLATTMQLRRPPQALTTS